MNKEIEPMLITDHFVMLNLPKTGSTFARTVIKELYAGRIAKQSLLRRLLQGLKILKEPVCKELLLPNIKLSGVNTEPDQHGTFSQIPDEYRKLPVISIIRNPYSRFMSGYEFRWWENHPPINDQLLAKHFTNFPNLTVDDFVRLNELDVIHGRLNGQIPNAEVGIQTIQFIQMFFKNPKKVLQNLSDEYLDSAQAIEDMAEIIFLRQEELNENLADFLASIGYSNEEVNYVRSRERVNITKAQSPNRNALWTPTSIDYVRRKERLIFRLLETKGIVYKEPKIVLPDVKLA
jgi:hypothetical protein